MNGRFLYRPIAGGLLVGVCAALMGAGGYVTAESVVAPSMLFEDLEFEKPQDDQPKLPLVPAPPLTASR